MGSPQSESQEAKDSVGPPPPPPEPSNDAGIVPSIKSPDLEGIDHLTPENVDIFTLDPVAALKLLCRGTQLLVDMTGDVPPTPAIRSPEVPLPSFTSDKPVAVPRKQALQASGFSSHNGQEHIDGVPFQRTPIGSPEAHIHEPIVHGTTSQPATVQYAALVRKFYSKRPPPISLEDYLSRLRIAMKALEDLSWPHGRFAKVGGISEPELARLEIGFCFLMDFGLKVDPGMLMEEAQHLVRTSNSSAIDEHDLNATGFSLTLPITPKKASTASDRENRSGDASGTTSPRSTAEKRKASSSLPMRPMQHVGQGIGIAG
ncbi:hypothetical protein LTS08_001061 [Lithohypha guttulata]|uniref:uncharacterized protein n=1 Tax=Lithohypha guttulata TaxID=1690604 RepID=UPI002DDDC0E6|nr:hypothetical protein LTR51_006328 [Lithohypha guttulata]KAK5106938.1 hypothetical protein LTS08_001061 [Lithohypha guttulata]